MVHSTDSKVPCHNCITLAICKARLNGGDMMDLMHIADGCSLLKAYVHPKNKEGMCIGDISLVDDVEKILTTNITYNPEPF